MIPAHQVVDHGLCAALAEQPIGVGVASVGGIAFHANIGAGKVWGSNATYSSMTRRAAASNMALF
jgi:hypothetical protein